MNPFDLCIVLGGIHLLAVTFPGPDTLLVVQSSLFGSRKLGLYTALGITIANGAHIGLVIICGSLLAQYLPSILLALKIGGSIYLIYLGTMGLYSAWKNPTTSDTDQVSHNSLSGFRDGFITSLFNPKAGLYFMGIVTQFITPDKSWLEATSLLLTLIVISFSWFSFLALSASIKQVQTKLRKVQFQLTVGSGFSFLLLGAAMLTMSIG